MLEIAAGGAHTCAVDVHGWVWCWGSNTTGQLGIGAKDALDHPTPERVQLACP